MIDLDASSPVPLYLQICEQVRRLIALGAIRPGDRLPTIRDLAVQARVNRNTVARAVQHLESAGVVRTRVGQGTFVQPPQPDADRPGRDAVIDASIERLLVEAHTRGMPFDELSRRVGRRIESFRRERDSSAEDPAARAVPKGTNDE